MTTVIQCKAWSEQDNEGRDGDLVLCLQGQRGRGKLTLQCQRSFSLLLQLLCQLLHLLQQSSLTLPQGLLTLHRTERRCSKESEKVLGRKKKLELQ